MKKNDVHLNQTKSRQLYLSYLRSLNKNQRGEAIFGSQILFLHWSISLLKEFTAVLNNTRPALSKAFQDFGFFCDVNQTVTLASTVFVK